MTTKLASAVLAIVFFLVPNVSPAAVFNVTNVAELQSALTTAQGNRQNDTIILAPGTYIIESPLSYFAQEEEDYTLVIQGAGAATTILDGNNTTSILQIDQSYLSEGMNAHVALKGITFRNGMEGSSWGGALSIANYYAQTTIEDCVFQDNTSSLGGGALYLIGSTVLLRRNSFSGNSSSDPSSVGGAVYGMLSGGTATFDKNTFADSFSAGSAGGMYLSNSGPVVLTENVIQRNVAGGEGGGGYISVEFGGTLTFSGNTVESNSAASSGGVLLSSQTDTIFVSANIFRDNDASASSQSHGGGLTVFSQYRLEMVNNLLAGNTATQRGAGAMVHLYTNASHITNNTFVANVSTGAYGESTSQGAGLFVVTDRNEAVLNIYNNIFWGNTAVAPTNRGADLYINDDGLNDTKGSTINLYNNDFSEMTILRGDRLFQGGNINEDPLFDTEYRLAPDSPCRDTGSNEAPGLAAKDLGGDPRIQGGTVDMGAYEWAPPRGTLQVMIAPEGAVEAGAKWRVDGGDWHESGETESLAVGSYTVEFRDLVGWTKPEDQIVSILSGEITTITGVYTKNPVFPGEGTIGTEITITGSGFGSKKGKVLLGSTSLTILEWGNDSIVCRLGKALTPGIYDVTIWPKGVKSPILHEKAFAVRLPQVSSVSPDLGATGDPITIHGKFFGTKKGKVYLGSASDGKVKSKSCPISDWRMDDPVTGASEVVLTIPKGLPPGTYDVTVTNKVGSQTVEAGLTIE